jgi:hypothetical protein
MPPLLTSRVTFGAGFGARLAEFVGKLSVAGDLPIHRGQHLLRALYGQGHGVADALGGEQDHAGAGLVAAAHDDAPVALARTASILS